MEFIKIFKSISKKEWYFLLIITVVLLVLANGTFLYNYLRTPPGSVYIGIHNISPADTPVYYSYINQIKEGNVLLKDVFTSEIQTSGIFNIVWLFVGVFARLFNLSEISAYHFTRILITPFLLVALYAFISHFFTSYKERITAFLLAFGSGVGIWFIPLARGGTYTLEGYGYHWPIDLWPISHAYLFTSIQFSPHLIFSWTLQILIFLFCFLAIYNNKKIYSVMAGSIALVLFNFHPYHAPIIFLTLGIYLFFILLKDKKKLLSSFWHVFIIVLLSAPSLLYHIWILKNNSVLAVRASQNIALLPPVQYVVIGYGLLLVFALLAMVILAKEGKFTFKILFLLSWFSAHALLIFPQTQLQSHLLQGWIIPMSLLATIFIFTFFKRYVDLQKNNIKRTVFLFFAVFVYIFFIFFSNIFNTAMDLYYYKQSPTTFYFSQYFMDSMAWVKENVSDSNIILSSNSGGLFIGGFTAKRVYLGHGHETLFKERKKEEVKTFYIYDDDIKRKQFLENNDIDFVFFGRFEKEYQGPGLESKSYLLPVYENNEIIIYSVEL